MFESRPRAGIWAALIVAAAAATFGCAAGEAPGLGGESSDLRAVPPPPEPPPFQCAGLLNVACPGPGAPEAQYLCADDWRDECDPARGGADCPGLCLGEALQTCGGPADGPCGAGEVCVHHPGLPCAPPSEGDPQCSAGVCALAACDPDLPCGDAETCVDGQLYPTSCGPTNCDAPVGPCDPWGECGPPPPCPAPPPECHYEGGGCAGGQWSCGTLDCDEPPPGP